MYNWLCKKEFGSDTLRLIFQVFFPAPPPHMTVISPINYLHNIHGQKHNFLLRTNLLHLIYICWFIWRDLHLPSRYLQLLVNYWGGVRLHLKFLQPLNLFYWNNNYLSWTSKNKLVQSSPNYSFDNSQLHAKIQYPRTTLYSGKVTTTEDNRVGTTGIAF